MLGVIGFLRDMSKNYFYNLLLSVVNVLFPVLSFPYASRILGPEGIGKVQFILTFAQYFALIAAIGIPIYGIKEIAKCKNDIYKRSIVFSELVTIYFLSSLILSAIYLGVILWFPFFDVDQEVYQIAVLIVFLGFSSIDWFYSGMEDFKNIALRSMLVKIISVLLLYWLVKDRNDYSYYLYIMIFSLLGNNILSLVLIGNRAKLVFTNLNLLRHLNPLLYIFSTTLAVSMYTVLDTTLLGFLSDEKAVGLYTAAVKLTKLTLPFVTSLGVILIPKIASGFADHNWIEVQKRLSQSFNFVIFFSVPIALGLFMLAPEFITIFSGADFIAATPSMRVLSLLPLIIGFGHFFLFLILVPGGKNREMIFSVLGGVITGLVLNAILIPAYKEFGSSVANVCSELVVTLFYFYFIQKHYKFVYDWIMIIRAIFCSVLFIPLIMLIRMVDLNMLISLAISIVLCTLLYISMQWLLYKNYFVLKVAEYIKGRLAFNDLLKS